MEGQAHHSGGSGPGAGGLTMAVQTVTPELFDLALKTLPEDASKDTPEQAAVRTVLVNYAMIAEILPPAIQSLSSLSQLMPPSEQP